MTATTRGLLQHWTDPARSRRLFFCQVEALETLIFIAEAAKQSKSGQAWIDEALRDAAAAAGTGLFRLACKMATGSGKEVALAMVVAWQTLNERHNPKDARLAAAFLVVAPGVTTRDRLRVLFPAEPSNYYRELDLVSAESRADLGSARIVVTNSHAFQWHQTGYAGGLTKRLPTARDPDAFTESLGELVNRVCGSWAPAARC